MATTLPATAVRPVLAALRSVRRTAARTAARAARVARPAWPALIVLAAAACSCPPRVDRFTTPQETLATYQARLCRDEAVGEYDCLAASLKRRIGLFDTYFAARTHLLEESPTAAYIFARADLADHVARISYAADGTSARLELSALGESLAMSFELEAWLTVTWLDGSTESRRLDRPLPGLLGAQAGRQWLDLLPPVLPPERLAEVRALAVDSRWKISDIEGLTAPPGAGTAAARPTPSSTDPGPLP